MSQKSLMMFPSRSMFGQNERMAALKTIFLASWKIFLFITVGFSLLIFDDVEICRKLREKIIKVDVARNKCFVYFLFVYFLLSVSCTPVLSTYSYYFSSLSL